MKVCVLAAGGGTRLRPLTDALPKALLPLPSGATIIESLLTRLVAELPVEEIVIAVGYRGDAIRAALGRAFGAIPIRYADNPEWATTPNAESLRRAANLLGSATTLLVDGDLVLAPGALRFPAPVPDLVLVRDPDVELDGEAMKIWVDDRDRVLALRKETNPGRPAGESIGISLWKDIGVLVRAIAALPPGEAQYYEDGINALLRSGAIRSALVTIPPRTWVEVDTAADYARAKKLELDWSPHLMRIVTARIEAADRPARALLARLGRGWLDRLAPGSALALCLIVAGVGLALLWSRALAAGMLVVTAAQAGSLVELFPAPPPRLTRWARFADRLLDFLVPMALAGPALLTGPGLLAAGCASAVCFLYFFTGISYVLIIPRSAYRSHPEALVRMNRAWLERGVILPFDRLALFLLLTGLAILLPPVPALGVFAVAAFLLWAWQSVRFWAGLRA